MVKKYTGLMLIIGPLLVIIGYMLQPQNQAFGEDPTDAAYVIGKLAAANSTLLDITTLMLTVGISTFLAGVYLANLRVSNENKEQDARTSWGMMGLFISFLGYMSATALQVAVNGAVDAGNNMAAGTYIGFGAAILGTSDIVFGIGLAVIGSAWADAGVYNKRLCQVLSLAGILIVLARVLLGFVDDSGALMASIGSPIYIVTTLVTVVIGIQIFREYS